MAEVVRRCRLINTLPGHYKEYTVTIERSMSPFDMYNVVCWYGRIGAKQARAERAMNVSRSSAENVYGDAVSEKQAKGYMVDSASQSGSFGGSQSLVPGPLKPPLQHQFASTSDEMAHVKLQSRGLSFGHHYGYANAAKMLTEMDLAIDMKTLGQWLSNRFGMPWAQQIPILKQFKQPPYDSKPKPKLQPAPKPAPIPADFSQPKAKRFYDLKD